MPRFEKTTGGEVYLRGIGERVSIGDVVDVSDSFADYLRDRGDFVEYVDDSTAEAEPTNHAEPEPESADSDSDESDTDGFNVDAWLEQDYQERADRVRAGDVDDHLDVLDEEETSDTVRDAIGERRAELEA
jgi:hypothetical protein